MQRYHAYAESGLPECLSYGLYMCFYVQSGKRPVHVHVSHKGRALSIETMAMKPCTFGPLAALAPHRADCLPSGQKRNTMYNEAGLNLCHAMYMADLKHCLSMYRADRGRPAWKDRRKRRNA